MKKNSKFKKLTAISISVALGVGAIGASIPLILESTSNTSSNWNDVLSPSSESGIHAISTANLNFNAVSNSSSKQATTVSTDGTQTLTTESGAKKSFKVSTLYKNDRKFMPILAYDNDDVANFTQGRKTNDIIVANFPGWTKNQLFNNYSQDGSYSYQYVASDILRNTFKLQQNKIDSLTISIDKTASVFGVEKVKETVLNLINKYEPDFLFIDNISDTTLKQIPELTASFLKKVTLSGSFTSLNGIKLSDKIQELSIDSASMKAVDPLVFPDGVALINDGNGSIFTSVDLSSHKNLSNDDLQKAVNIVYKDRTNERAFQGDFAGGYIYVWNLRGTGITTLNSVTIPKLEDGTGRFYIGYVAVESSSNSNGTANEVVNPGTTPSNDSQVGEWYDWNQEGWSKVTEVVVTAKDSAKLDFSTTVKEIMGFLAKYPNVVKINISSLTFTDSTKTLENLKESIKDAIISGYFDGTSKADNIEFITTSSAKK